MKLAAALLTGMGSSEIAWHWYSVTVMSIGTSLQLIVVFTIAIACAVIGWGLET